MSSPVIGDEAITPLGAKALCGAPSRDRMPRASPRIDVGWTKAASIIVLSLRSVDVERSSPAWRKPHRNGSLKTKGGVLDRARSDAVIQRSGLALDVSIPETLLATADEVIE
jgi:hypothetical protein